MCSRQHEWSGSWWHWVLVGACAVCVVLVDVCACKAWACPLQHSAAAISDKLHAPCSSTGRPPLCSSTPCMGAGCTLLPAPLPAADECDFVHVTSLLLPLP